MYNIQKNNDKSGLMVMFIGILSIIMFVAGLLLLTCPIAYANNTDDDHVHEPVTKPNNDTPPKQIDNFRQCNLLGDFTGTVFDDLTADNSPASLLELYSTMQENKQTSIDPLLYKNVIQIVGFVDEHITLGDMSKNEMIGFVFSKCHGAVSEIIDRNRNKRDI